MRRIGRRNARRRPFAPALDPFRQFAADRAWRADDAIDNGSVTTSLPNYLGPALALAPQGTGQAVKALSANLGGKYSIACDGLTASSGYSAVALAGAPTSFSIASVYYLAAVAVSGVSALTAGGVALSGVSQYRNTTLRSEKLGSDALSAITPPIAVVQVSVYTATTVLHYASRYTAVSASIAGALAGTTFHVMCRASNASVPSPMTGEWASAGYWTRSLSQAEVAGVLRGLGRRYSVAIAA